MNASIEAQLPDTWQELETVVGRILTACGYDIEVGKNVKLARGDVAHVVRPTVHSSAPATLSIRTEIHSVRPTPSRRRFDQWKLVGASEVRHADDQEGEHGDDQRANASQGDGADR